MDCSRVLRSRSGNSKPGLDQKKTICAEFGRGLYYGQVNAILEAPIELHGVKANIRPWGMFIVAIVCSIAFYTPVAGQRGGDPAKAQMEEMNRRELQLNNLGGDKAHSHDPQRP